MALAYTYRDGYGHLSPPSLSAVQSANCAVLLPAARSAPRRHFLDRLDLL